MSGLSQTEVRNELWRRGNLAWKLHEGQKSLYELFYNTKHKTNVWLCGRRIGKSYTLVVIALEACLRTPNIVVKIVSPTKMQVDTNLRPLFKKILDDCPATLKPTYKAKDYTYYFPNGSEIQLAGTDGGHAEKLRGSETALAIVDEAGSCEDLKNVVKNILLPSTLLSRGKVILASTPPMSYEHDFISFIQEAEVKGTLIKKPSHSNPLIPPEEMELMIKELGGVNSETYKREVLCEIIRDSNLSVIPEFTVDLEKEVVQEWVKPPFYDGYVGMDLGFKDFTGVIFGYYDFKSDCVVIEDEILMNFQESDKNLPVLTKQIIEKESIHFLDLKTNEVKKPFKRVSDLNPIVVQEIGRISHYEVTFMNANKSDKDASLNKFRLLISNKKIMINPRCVNLIRQIKNARWASETNKKTFSRSVVDGHYDLLDAAIMLVDSIAYGKNPYPQFYNMNTQDLFIKNRKNQQLSNNNYEEVFNKIFNVPRKKP